MPSINLVRKRKKAIDKKKSISYEEKNQLSELDIIYNTNLFRLQTDEFLRENIVDYDIINKSYEKIKSHLISIPALAPIKLDSFLSLIAEKNILFPLKKFEDFNQILSFKTPNKIYASGSFLDRTMLKNAKVDIHIIYDEQVNKNDIKKRWYLIKRCVILCHIVYHLISFDYKIRFTVENTSYCLPYILVHDPACDVNFILRPIITQICGFKLHNFLPNHQNYQSIGADRNLHNYHLTAFFNQYILKELHEFNRTIELSECQKIAFILLKSWVQSLPFYSSTYSINGYILRSIISYLNFKKMLHSHMTTYQVLRVVFNFISKDLLKESHSFNDTDFSSSSLNVFKSFFPAVLCDSSGLYNILFYVSKNNLDMFVHEANRALEHLNLVGIDASTAFYDIFVKKVLFRDYFDNYAHIKISHTDWLQLKSEQLFFQNKYDIHYRGLEAFSVCLRRILNRGLSNHTYLIFYQNTIHYTWNINEKYQTDKEITFGFLLKSHECDETVIVGPLVNSPEAISFREFFGHKSVLMKFKDGTLKEIVRFEPVSKTTPQSSPEQILRFLLNIHCNLIQADIAYLANQFDQLVDKDLYNIYHSGTLHDLDRSFTQIVNLLNGKRIQNFLIKSIHPTSSTLSKTDFSTKFYQNKFVIHVSFKRSPFPDDLNGLENCGKYALAHICRFLCENLIPAQIVSSYITFIYNDFLFKSSVFIPRRLKMIHHISKTTISFKTEYELQSREFHFIPAHVEFIKYFSVNHPSFIHSCRLFKRWISSQLLYEHISEQICELLVAFVYLHPYPNPPPHHHWSAFIKILRLLFTFDWNDSILILLPQIDPDKSKIHQDNISRLDNQMKLNRAELPCALIYTSFDTSATCFTSSLNPAIFKRLIMLSCASHKILTTLWPDEKSFVSPFVPNLNDFHILIELEQADHTYSMSAEVQYPFFNPASEFLNLLKSYYSDILEFFYSPHDTRVICAVLKLEEIDCKFTVKNAYHRSLTNATSKITDQTNCTMDMKRLKANIALIGKGICKDIKFIKK